MRAWWDCLKDAEVKTAQHWVILAEGDHAPNGDRDGKNEKDERPFM